MSRIDLWSVPVMYNLKYHGDHAGTVDEFALDEACTYNEHAIIIIEYVQSVINRQVKIIGSKIINAQ